MCIGCFLVVVVLVVVLYYFNSFKPGVPFMGHRQTA